MPTGALSISIPDASPTTTTKHSATRPTFFPTVAWWKRFPRPFKRYINDEGERNFLAEEGLLDDYTVGDGVISAGMVGSGVGMMRDAGSGYWRKVREQSHRRGVGRFAVEILGGVGVVVAVVGLVGLLFRG